jgi:ubiquinone/menaquinone biosynthesis C-methylase UbiE
MKTSEQLKTKISQIYADKVQDRTGCCGDGDCGDGVYQIENLKSMPQGVVSFGCGNPVALANLLPGDTALDLGSGAGLDCFLAAHAVGPGGHIIGVDFTQVMIDRATENAAKLGLTNVSFRLGDIEALPFDDATVDVVISNCVINLAPDKDAVFREALRVLRPGGRLMVSDILLTRPATQEEMDDMALRSGCISGSLPTEQYLDKLRSAGFEDVRFVTEHEAKEGQFWFSAAVLATRPGSA